MKYLYLFLIVFCGSLSVFGQTNLPIIRATSKNVAINDGGYLDENAWTLSPEAKPDIYIADRSQKTKKVTFYTDIDSISVKLKPGTVFDFIILLNGKDSCFTQIASAVTVDNGANKDDNAHDTIPFVLTSHDAIWVKSVVNDRDTLNLHFDISTEGIRITKDAIFKKTALLSGQPDALSGLAKPDYNHLGRVFKIQMGNYVLNNPAIRPANLASHDMDGRFGWQAFDGKVVEIDYDKNILIIHSTLPKRKKGFVKSKIKFIHSMFCIEAAIEVDNKKYYGDFLFDSGSDLSMVLDSAWMHKQGFPNNLQLLSKMTFRDGAGRAYEAKKVLVPQLQVNANILTDIPTSLLGSQSPVGFEINCFGNEVLKRFNVIIDLKHDNIYLKPNGLMQQPYKTSS